MIQGLTAHVGLEFRTAVRDRTLLLMTYLFPLGFYGFMGLFMTRMNPPFAETMIAGMSVIAIISASLFSLPGPLISARETGVLRSYQVSGVPNGAVYGVPAGTTVAHLVIVGLIIAITAPLLFDGWPVSNFAGFILVMVVAGFAHAGLGALVGVVSANSRVSVLWSQALFLPSMMLSGVVVPLSQLPEAFQPFSLFLPATYAMESFTGMALGSGTTLIHPWAALAVLGVGAVLAFGLTKLCYAWDEHGSGRRIPIPFAGAAILPYVLTAVILGVLG